MKIVDSAQVAKNRAADALRAVLHHVSAIKLKEIDMDSLGPNSMSTSWRTWTCTVTVIRWFARLRPVADPIMSALLSGCCEAMQTSLPEIRRLFLLRRTCQRRRRLFAGKVIPVFSTWKEMHALI